MLRKTNMMNLCLLAYCGLELSENGVSSIQPFRNDNAIEKPIAQNSSQNDANAHLSLPPKKRMINRIWFNDNEGKTNSVAAPTGKAVPSQSGSQVARCSAEKSKKEQNPASEHDNGASTTNRYFLNLFDGEAAGIDKSAFGFDRNLSHEEGVSTAKKPFLANNPGNPSQLQQNLPEKQAKSTAQTRSFAGHSKKPSRHQQELPKKQAKSTVKNGSKYERKIMGGILNIYDNKTFTRENIKLLGRYVIYNMDFELKKGDLAEQGMELAEPYNLSEEKAVTQLPMPSMISEGLNPKNNNSNQVQNVSSYKQYKDLTVKLRKHIIVNRCSNVVMDMERIEGLICLNLNLLSAIDVEKRRHLEIFYFRLALFYDRITLANIQKYTEECPKISYNKLYDDRTPNYIGGTTLHNYISKKRIILENLLRDESKFPIQNTSNIASYQKAMAIIMNDVTTEEKKFDHYLWNLLNFMPEFLFYMESRSEIQNKPFESHVEALYEFKLLKEVLLTYLRYLEQIARINTGEVHKFIGARSDVGKPRYESVEPILDKDITRLRKHIIKNITDEKSNHYILFTRAFIIKSRKDRFAKEMSAILFILAFVQETNMIESNKVAVKMSEISRASDPFILFRQYVQRNNSYLINTVYTLQMVCQYYRILKNQPFLNLLIYPYRSYAIIVSFRNDGEYGIQLISTDEMLLILFDDLAAGIDQ